MKKVLNLGETPSWSETGNFNVALVYANTEIMRWLYLCTEYKTVARYGSSDLEENFQLSEDEKVERRIEALKRMIDCLENIMDNSEFGLKEPEDKDTMNELRKKLSMCKQYLPLTEEKIFNEREKTFKRIIHERAFNIILDNASQIQKEIKYPLNNNDMIFLSPPEEFDPDEFMKKTEEDWIHGG